MRDTKVMADRLAARTARGSHWGSTGRGMVAFGRSGRARCGGIGLLQASDLSISPPLKQAVGTQGALRGWISLGREYLSHLCSCHGEASSLVVDCVVNPTLSCGYLHLSPLYAEMTGNDVHVSFLNDPAEDATARDGV